MSNILYPIEWVVVWIMVKFHDLLSLVLDPHSGLTWLLSIVGLTVVVRIIILPLFARQIKASRAMQLASPELQAIQKKYKGKTDPESRQAMASETMAVYREHGASPVSSCLPILVQMPIFFGLFRVLFYKLPEHADGGASAGESFGILTPDLANSAHNAIIFGQATISDSFISGDIAAKIITGFIIAAMVIVTFVTQRELTMRNLPPSALEGPMAQTQKIMLYMLPFIYVISGPSMPMGVLVYWLTTNVWTFFQQWWMISRNPTPGSAAEKARHERINAKREKKGLEPIDFTPKKTKRVLEIEEQQIRVQPKRYENGRRLSDEEMLERARAARKKALEERRAERQAKEASEGSKPSTTNALNKKKRKK
ncbi:MAG: membrane protein insertase YidC [Dermabacter sp.]|nr:membrane protein insertase YidC [Dermabacter sp.]